MPVSPSRAHGDRWRRTTSWREKWDVWRASVGWCSQVHGMKLKCATPDPTDTDPSDTSTATRLAGHV
ncbi:hypothetical protein TIFTF001_021497 [Ficus carica]|uniref:Uncharacterized protein n=1 Tax=Ficus carica TaxID=3494 RepID=A0AA88ASL8_FICCA|nr:hypothetical protein TIFTF001_021497 [Ficus carica]